GNGSLSTLRSLPLGRYLVDLSPVRRWSATDPSLRARPARSLRMTSRGAPREKRGRSSCGASEPAILSAEGAKCRFPNTSFAASIAPVFAGPEPETGRSDDYASPD